MAIAFLGSIALWLATAPLLLLTAVFAIELAAGLPPLRSRRRPADRSHRRTAIVMPANNEAKIISATLGALMPNLPPNCSVFVVADNCVDDTASLAAEAGATVLVRNDIARRGKGFALAHARDILAQQSTDDIPETVIVLDADCTTNDEALQILAGAADDQPLQATYLLVPDRDAPPMVQVSNFAFAIKNLVRQRGLARLAGRVNLTGTGMAFPWAIFRDAPLATADIVEDLSLGLDLARRGTPPQFAQEATVWSVASDLESTMTQRTRWEGGFMATARTYALPALATAIRRADPRGAWAALSLAVPPLTLLLTLDLIGLAALCGLAMVGTTPWPAIVLAGLIVAAMAGLALAWVAIGRPFLSGKAAIRLPVYLLWKIPLYMRLLANRPTAWLRPGR